MSDIKFRFSSEDAKFHVTGFYYIFSTNMFHINLEYGVCVKQLELCAEEVERIGLIDLSKLKIFTDQIK